MQTKLTLDEAWEKSLKMWKWIAEWWEKDDNIEELKVWWLEHNGYVNNELIDNCFLCEYAGEEDTEVYCGASCDLCPAAFVQYGFCCHNTRDYHYARQPVAFYNKLVELNEIRLKGK